VLLYPPLRRALAIAFANMLSTLHSLKVAGMELTLDPEAAQAMAAKSTVVVQNAYEHEADDEVRRRRVWEKFTWIVEHAVRPLAQPPNAGFRSTIHIKDILQPETLYQLVEYYHAAESSEAYKTRGRRISIRAGIGGRAWRLKKPLYADVPDDVTELVEHWGMTSNEAATLVAHGRQSFAVIPLYSQDHQRYRSDDPDALIFIDAKQRCLFGAAPIDKLNDKIIDKLSANINAAARDNGLIASLVQVTRALAEDFQSQTQ